MGQGRGAIGKAIGGAALLGSLLATWAWAQEAPPPRLALDLSANLSRASNPDLLASGGTAETGAETGAGLSLGLTFATQTRDESFRLRLGAGLAATEGLDRPALDLSYERKGATAAFQLKAVHAETDVDGDDALSATGRVRDSDLSLGLQTGTAGPIGTSFLAQAHVKDYGQASDPSVYDSTSQTLSAGMTLRGLAGGDVSLTLRRTAADFEDILQTSREGLSLTLGYDRALDAATRLTASLGQTEAETRKLGLSFARSEGLTGALALQRALGNGTAELGFQSSRDATGARQSLQFSRALKLATASFAARIGLSARAGGQAEAVGQVSWTQDLPSDSLTLSLSREVALNEDEADTLQSTLSARWTHRLGETMQLGLSYGLTGVTGAAGAVGVDGTLRHSVTASYGQDLTRDWALRAGVTLTQIDRDSTGQARDETVFLSISRSLTLLP